MEGALIWLVEPSDSDARWFQLALEEAAIPVTVRRSTTGVAAIDAIQAGAERVDIIICPPVLPILHVSDFVTAVRRLRPEALLVIAADAILVTAPWVTGCHADAYVTKPISAEQIRNLLSRASEPKQRSAPTVLVVDDDQSFLSAVTSALTTSGYNVVEATDVEHAYSVLDKQPDNVNVALIDLDLPDKSGLDFIHTLTKRPASSIKIIATTGVLSDLHLEIASYMGAHLSIRKPAYVPGQPFPASQWTTAVSKLLDRGQSQ